MTTDARCDEMAHMVLHEFYRNWSIIITHELRRVARIFVRGRHDDGGIVAGGAP